MKKTDDNVVNFNPNLRETIVLKLKRKIIIIKNEITKIQKLQEQNKNILNMENTKKEQDILKYKTYMKKLINQFRNIYSS